MSFDDLQDSFDEVIIEARGSTILKMKAQLIAQTLESNILELMQFLDNNPDVKVEKQLDELKTLLDTLLHQINDNQINQTLLLSLIDDTKISDIILDINTTLSKIHATLCNIGVPNPTKCPEISFSTDNTNIYDFFDHIIQNAQQKKKESQQMINQSTNSSFNFSNETTKAITQRYSKYIIKKKDIRDISNEPLFYSNDQFEYFTATYNRKPVILVKSTNNLYIDRILDVLTQLNSIKEKPHPSIEKLVGFYEENKKIVIVTENRGQNLFNIMHKKDKTTKQIKLKPGDRTKLAFKIALAMMYINSKNIMHRNLSTCCIEVNELEGEINPIIINFITSRLLPDKSYNSHVSTYKSLFNVSPKPFFAPEFYKTESYSEAIDVFAFSGILYELATGEVPFQQKNPAEIIELITNGNDDDENCRPNLDKLNESPKLAELIKKCWKTNPEDRLTFSEIINEMNENTIVFPQDFKEEEQIKDFYKKNQTTYNQIQNCIITIDKIKKFINVSYQYRNELYAIKSFLNKYQEYLIELGKNENIKTDDVNIDSLYENLIELSKLVEKTSETNFDMMIPTLDASYVTENVVKYMNAIGEEMEKIQYSSSENYRLSDEDLVNDYRELDIIFKTDVKFRKLRSIKRKQIRDYFEKKLKKLELWKKFTLGRDEQVRKRVSSLLDKYAKMDENDPVSKRWGDGIDDSEYDDDYLGVINREKNSTLYDGITRNTNTPVIMKIFDLRYLQSEKNCKNLQQEIENMKKINPNYIQQFRFFNFDEDNCEVWIVIDSLEGLESKLLKNRIKDMSSEEKTKISFKIAELFDHLINQQINYRDINSSNIIVDGENVKLLDLGDETLDDYPLSFSKILYEMLTGEKIQQYSNFRFNGNEESKSELEKLIELGFQTNTVHSFSEIINTMHTYKNQINF